MPIKYRNNIKTSFKTLILKKFLLFTYKYLGITIDCNGSIEEHLSKL